MKYMFDHCEKATEIKYDINNFITSSVTDMTNMFGSCLLCLQCQI